MNNKNTVNNNKMKGDFHEDLHEQGKIQFVDNYEKQQLYGVHDAQGNYLGDCKPDFVILDKNGDRTLGIVEVKSGVYGEKSEHFTQVTRSIALAAEKGCPLIYATPDGTDNQFTDKIKAHIASESSNNNVKVINTKISTYEQATKAQTNTNTNPLAMPRPEPSTKSQATAAKSSASPAPSNLASLAMPRPTSISPTTTNASLSPVSSSPVTNPTPPAVSNASSLTSANQ
jgi:hypothetical protein